jgi:hypothetical protein
MHRFHKWRDALNVAPDEETLLEVMRDYVSAIEPRLVALLPPECQRALHPDVDLQAAAVSILHAELAFGGDEPVAELLHEVAHTYAAASIRLSKLRTEPILPAKR